ncbi:putative calmodulin-lysine N-methyltransferase [Apostichopus japonicus]|uniref:Calmodulin-lysine N-methyltransferase n=1 Tax=Stichopus japonicus TaxID=307972 RepID=A0A2G8JLJ2_STIJA|nr:putative calmodulin-lysine N-methyltransferase [Apostichopus japonicus]
MKNADEKSNVRKKAIAKSRWKLIYKALKNEAATSSTDENVSVMRFKSFGFLQQKSLPEMTGSEDVMWSQISFDESHEYSLKIRQLNMKLSAQDLIGFNNTGNVCRSKSVCELGGGMTCLAGFTVACTSNAKEVLVTDGNLKSCQNAEIIAKENHSKFGTTKVSVRQLLWNKQETFADLKEKFDIVVGADCFFFDDYRQDLVNTIKHILKPEGIAWMFAPQRGSTLKKFQEIAEADFTIELQENYDLDVWAKHQKLNSSVGDAGHYDENIHYPWLMILQKSPPLPLGLSSRMRCPTLEPKKCGNPTRIGPSNHQGNVSPGTDQSLDFDLLTSVDWNIYRLDIDAINNCSNVVETL